MRKIIDTTVRRWPRGNLDFLYGFFAVCVFGAFAIYSKKRSEKLKDHCAEVLKQRILEAKESGNLKDEVSLESELRKIETLKVRPGL